MLVEERALVVEQVVNPLVRREYQVEIHARDVDEYEIVRRLGEHEMKVKVRLSAVARKREALLRRGDDAQQTHEVGRRRPHRALAGDGGVEYAPRLHKFEDGGVFELDAVLPVVGHLARLAHETSLARYRLYESEQLHDAERLAQRAAAHAEGLHELALRGQRVAREQTPVGDLLLELLHNLFINSRSLYGCFHHCEQTS